MRYLAELALVGAPFTDGRRVGVWDLVWRGTCPDGPDLGLPLTLLVTALFAHYVAGLPWHRPDGARRQGVAVRRGTGTGRDAEGSSILVSEHGLRKV